MISFRSLGRVFTLAGLMTLGLLPIGQIAHAQSVPELLASLVAAAQPKPNDGPDSLEKRVGTALTALNESRRFPHYSRSDDAAIENTLGDLLSSHKIPGDGNYVLTNSLISRVAPQRMFNDREALLTALRRTILSEDQAVREASVGLTMNYFRREILPKSPMGRDGAWGSVGKIAGELAHPFNGTWGRGLSIIFEAPSSYVRAVMSFADLSTRPELLREISKWANGRSLRADAIETLIEPMRPKSQAELDALISFTSGLTDFHAQDAAMHSVYAALHSEPPIGRLTPATQESLRTIAANGSHEATRLLSKVDGPEVLPDDVHSLLRLLGEIHPGDTPGSAEARNQRILVELSRKVSSHRVTPNEEADIGRSLDYLIKQNRFHGDGADVLVEDLIMRVAGRHSHENYDALLASVRRTLLDRDPDVQKAALRLAESYFHTELQLPSSFKDEGSIFTAAEELANVEATGNGNGVRYHGVDYILYHAPNLGHALLRAADLRDRPDLIEQIGKTVKGQSDPGNRANAVQALVEPLRPRNLETRGALTALAAQLQPQEREMILQRISDAAHLPPLAICAHDAMEAAEGGTPIKVHSP